jgi:hypothetical protein
LDPREPRQLVPAREQEVQAPADEAARHAHRRHLVHELAPPAARLPQPAGDEYRRKDREDVHQAVRMDKQRSNADS